ncbi:peptide-methionine (R)-S-oxide reductase MsrB [Sphingobium sp. AS12]|uniref:peptide-methionine (R)-S-oxide reductase MsrB n=1 Tax=Sphingobium sp. AS12 TaxID=2849495 RepID=UPI001C314D60|nr:peptide-methionine (R)-S-oxide reductase MsrB [Sphingobium sp. AS12]MBV2149621.1 peptide-methionine (R)-S-oxide reductase MsrB [Sphingobium sp. AS12]
MNRRLFLSGVATGAAALGWWRLGLDRAEAAYPFALSDAEWRKRLSPLAYNVLRKQATEHPFTSPLNKEHRTGIFACAGCGQKLFSSKTKFDSGTGWPSFYAPLPKAVGTSRDFDLGYPRTEVHCARCGGHLGHVFDDGPKPTGLRYCMNGVALSFVAT